MKEEHEEASGQKRTEVNLWEDVVCFFVRSCHGTNCAFSRYEGSGLNGETQWRFAGPTDGAKTVHTPRYGVL